MFSKIAKLESTSVVRKLLYNQVLRTQSETDVQGGSVTQYWIQTSVQPRKKQQQETRTHVFQDCSAGIYYVVL